MTPTVTPVVRVEVVSIRRQMGRILYSLLCFTSKFFKDQVCAKGMLQSKQMLCCPTSTFCCLHISAPAAAQMYSNVPQMIRNVWLHIERCQWHVFKVKAPQVPEHSLLVTHHRWPRYPQDRIAWVTECNRAYCLSVSVPPCPTVRLGPNMRTKNWRRKEMTGLLL